MKNLLLHIFLILAGIPVYSQAPASEMYDSTLRIGLMGFEYRNSAERYKGNQYFNSWTKGELYLENGDVISNIFLRYDKYMDEVLWLRETDFKTGVLPRGDIRGFVLYNQQKDILAEFVRRSVKLPYKSDSSETFLQVLVKGDLELFAYRKVMQSANDYRLLDDTRYLLFTNGKSYFVDAGKRQLGKVPEIDGTRMKAIFKYNHFKLDGTENSLIRFIDLYNKGN